MRRKKLILFQSTVAQSDFTMPPLVSGLQCNNKNSMPQMSHSAMGYCSWAHGTHRLFYC